MFCRKYYCKVNWNLKTQNQTIVNLIFNEKNRNCIIFTLSKSRYQVILLERIQNNSTWYWLKFTTATYNYLDLQIIKYFHAIQAIQIRLINYIYKESVIKNIDSRSTTKSKVIIFIFDENLKKTVISDSNIRFQRWNWIFCWMSAIK